MSLIEVKNMGKIYNIGTSHPKVVFSKFDLKIENNEFVCLMGPSGSGKTTLINLLSTIDKPTSGHILIRNQDLLTLSAKVQAQLRREDIGFIFQNFNLLPTLNVKDNILLTLRLNNAPIDIQNKRLEKYTKLLHIEDILNKFPGSCSGGQQQRIAIARALMSNPKILFCDEPTGNLDSIVAKELMEFLEKLNKEENKTIVMVTHDNFVASYSTHFYYLKDGQIQNELERQDISQEEYYKDIVSITTHMDLRGTK